MIVDPELDELGVEASDETSDEGVDGMLHTKAVLKGLWRMSSMEEI